MAVIVSFLAIDFLFGKAMDRFAAKSRGGDTRNIYYICNEFDDSVAVFGSSRANHHYDSSLLGEELGLPVYNCGRDGNGILLAYCYLLNMVSNGNKPSLVVYDFFPSFDLYDNNDHQRAVNTISPYFRNPGMKEVIEDYTPGEYSKLQLSTYRYNSRFIQIVSDAFRPRQTLVKGYKPLEGTITTDFTEGKKTAEPIDTLKVKYLKKFIELCEDNDIDLVFVTSPAYHYIENPEETTQLFETYVGEDYHLFNFQNHEAFTGHRELFVDPAHMNHQGAELFTSMLADSISSRR